MSLWLSRGCEVLGCTATDCVKGNATWLCVDVSVAATPGVFLGEQRETAMPSLNSVARFVYGFAAFCISMQSWAGVIEKELTPNQFQQLARERGLEAVWPTLELLAADGASLKVCRPEMTPGDQARKKSDFAACQHQLFEQAKSNAASVLQLITLNAPFCTECTVVRQRVEQWSTEHKQRQVRVFSVSP